MATTKKSAAEEPAEKKSQTAKAETKNKKTTASKTRKERSPEEESALKELFVDELKDIYWAEKQMVKNLKKMAKAATSEKLKQAFEMHLAQTESQMERLEKVFELVEEKAAAKKCEAMAGLTKEAEELMEDTDEGTEVRDVALISAAQKSEHYEIASYGTLKTLAAVLGYSEAESLLEETLEEEKTADVKLTELAEGFINEAAAQETK